MLRIFTEGESFFEVDTFKMPTSMFHNKEIIYQERTIKFLCMIFIDAEKKILEGENIELVLDQCLKDVKRLKPKETFSNPKVSYIRKKPKTNKRHKPRLSVLESDH